MSVKRGVAQGVMDESHKASISGSSADPSFSTALNRFLEQGDCIGLESANMLLEAVLHRAMNAMAPSILRLTKAITADGFVTPDDVRVRSATSGEASGPALVLERDGVGILVCMKMHPLSRWGGTDVDAPVISSVGAGGTCRPEPRVAWLEVDLLFRTDEGPAGRPLYQIGAWHETQLDEGCYPHEKSRAATVTDIGLGFLPFEMLRSALDASAMLDAVRERSGEIDVWDRVMAPQRAKALVQTELVGIIAPLDGGIPGPMTMRHLMKVSASAAAARLHGTVPTLPHVIDALIVSGHVSLHEAYDLNGVMRVHVVPLDGGATIHLDCTGDRFEVAVTFDGEGSVQRVDISRSTHPDPVQVSKAGALPIFGRGNKMGTYLIRDGMLTPHEPLPDDFDLSRQVEYLRYLVSYVSKSLDAVSAAVSRRVRSHETASLCLVAEWAT